jgi:hypothetical protein
LDVERLDAIVSPYEPGFSMPPASALRQSPVIFRSTKLRAQLFCPAIPENQQPDDACHHSHRDPNDDGYFRGTQCWYVHDLPPMF